MRIIFFITLCFFSTSLLAQDKLTPNTAGPNCHSLHVAYSENGGNSYNQIAKGIINSASVPDAVSFKDKNLIYYVNGDFDNHSIYVSEIANDGKSSKVLGPITLDGKIIKDAVDPDLIVTPDGRLRLFYYVGLFTKPVTYPKPNKFYSAISDDGINFEVEGVVAELDNSTDPTVTRLKDGSYLMAIPQSKELKITILRSMDGYKFQEITSIAGGIPELSINLDGNPEILFQDQQGMVRQTSADFGSTWKTDKKNVLINGLIGAASPSILEISEQKRFLYYFSAKEGCTTHPTAYLEDKNALLPSGHKSQAKGEPPLGHGAGHKNQAIGEPPLGHGAGHKNQAKGEPPLGHGVRPEAKNK